MANTLLSDLFYDIPITAKDAGDYSIPHNCVKLGYHGSYLRTIEGIPSDIKDLYLDRSRIEKLPDIPDSVARMYVHGTSLSSPLKFSEGSNLEKIDMTLGHRAKQIYQTLPPKLETIHFNDKVIIEQIPDSTSKIFYYGKDDSFMAMMRLHGFRLEESSPFYWYRKV